MFSLGIEFGSETTDCGFHIVNNWLVRVTRGLISLVDDNHVDKTFSKFWRMCTLVRLIGPKKQSIQKVMSISMAPHWNRGDSLIHSFLRELHFVAYSFEICE